MKILHFHSDNIVLMGIPYAFHLMGEEIEVAGFKPILGKAREEDITRIEDLLHQRERTDLVTTYDFVPSVSQACENQRIPYLAWVYDCPQTELYASESSNTYTWINIFDRAYYRYLKGMGHIRNLLYHPLGADLEAFSSVVITPEDEVAYAAEVSFLGRLYRKNYIRTVLDRLTPEQCLEVECFSNGEGEASDVLIDCIYKMLEKTGYETDHRIFVRDSFLAALTNEKLRQFVLNRLAEKYPVCLYTDEQNLRDLSQNIQLRGRQDYWGGMPKVFSMSKVNLNISSVSIHSGIPQRVWDILAVGGFCMTDYRPEIEEYFEPGRDLVVYRDEEELLMLVDYYLRHERERVQIGINGYRKVKESGTMTGRLRTIFNEIQV